MGSYSEIYISEYPIISSKNEPLRDLWILFAPEEFRTYKRRICNRNPIAWGDQSGDKTFEMATEVRTTVKKFRQRLEFLGYTLAFAEAEFVVQRRELMKSMNTMKKFDPSLLETWTSRKQIIKKLTFSRYLEDLGFVISTKSISIGTINPEFPFKNFRETLIGYSKYGIALEQLIIENQFSILRCLCEKIPDDDEVYIDFTEIISGGWFAFDGNPISEYHKNEPKICILTEGSTDSISIDKCMKLLRPELAFYFSVMDFNISSLQGGASFLIHTVKSFISARIPSKVVAIFDNDTAGINALQSFDLKALPSNIVVTRLPDIPLAENYPCLGPAGESFENINNRSCSIELYFGVDILAATESLTQIRWKSYDDKSKNWQGEILNKNELFHRFLKKVDKYQCATSQNAFPEMEILIEHIVRAAKSINIPSIDSE